MKKLWCQICQIWVVQIHLKWILNLNLKSKEIKNEEENSKDYLHYLKVGKDDLKRQKAQKGISTKVGWWIPTVLHLAPTLVKHSVRVRKHLTLLNDEAPQQCHHPS